MTAWYKGVAAAGLLAATIAGAATTARAEVDEVHLVRQFGIGYLPLTIMLHEKLIEKHAAKAGMPNLKTKWSVLGNAVPINDGLIAGTIHFGSGGVAPMVTAWDRTRGSVRMHGVGALCALPVFLVSRHPYKSVKDFKENDRISMAGAGQSIQTLYLQIAVAKEFGIANFKKLNPLFVNLSHPDGLAALLSGGEVSASFLAPPFQYRAIDKGMHKVLSSYDVMGGPTSFLSVWSTGAFRDANPKTYKAVVDAFREATGIINADRARAAAIYVKDVSGKEKIEDVIKSLSDPEFIYDLGPKKMMPLVDFMHSAGIIKSKPASWKEVFFPEVHDLKGD
ncbi:MAG TPA: ABC transporter substrate-binding protein [Hyphomicrobiaceae bacterium]|nr:ABC transporter substrate-binding protein [Hyphomicrobiaceae bacterium]